MLYIKFFFNLLLSCIQVDIVYYSLLFVISLYVLLYLRDFVVENTIKDFKSVDIDFNIKGFNINKIKDK